MRYLLQLPASRSRPRRRPTCWCWATSSAPSATARAATTARLSRSCATRSSPASVWSPTARRGGCSHSAAVRRSSCASSTGRSSCASGWRCESFPEPGDRPGVAVQRRRLRPVPRARGRDLVHGRQRRDRHAGFDRGGVVRLDAGHLRRRRLRRRHRRAALPPAGAGARLALPAPAGRRHAAQPRQRRDPRASARARHASGGRLPPLAPARPLRAHRARTHGAIRLAGRPRGHGGARRGDHRGFRGAARLGGLRGRELRRRPDAATRPSRADRRPAPSRARWGATAAVTCSR